MDPSPQPSAGGLRCLVVTPEETAVDQQADFVVAPLFDGEIGIAPGHSALIGRLGFGELRVRAAGVTTRYFVEGGFVQVVDNVVSVMTGRAMPADRIDVEAARESLEASLALPGGAGLAAIRQREIDLARGQLRVARASGTR